MPIQQNGKAWNQLTMGIKDEEGAEGVELTNAT